MHCLIALVLGVVLTGFTSIARANSEDAPTPPTLAIPFDEETEAALQAEVTRQVLAFLQTVQAHWGQHPEALRLSVAGLVEREEEGKLIYLRNLSDHGVLEGYEFHHASLVRGQYILLQRPVNGLNEFIEYYRTLKELLTAKYGSPTNDQTVWDNDLYQLVPDYWGVAVLIGHLRYHAAWETAEGTITLELTGNRHSRLFLEYKNRTKRAHT
jgi:DNA-binding transcriptional ArsR family regulator